MTTSTKTPVTPLYALAGAGDLAIEKLREVREDVTARFAALKDQPKSVQAEFNKRFETLAADARTVPTQLRDLPAFVQTKMSTVVGQAEATYDELAGRGKDLVTRIRKQQATEDLATAVKNTVGRAKATRNTAKATATSAKKTAKTAAKATGDTAGKVGD